MILRQHFPKIFNMHQCKHFGIMDIIKLNDTQKNRGR